MSNLFPSQGQVAAETPADPNEGLFSAGPDPVIMQRMQSLAQSQLTPEQNGAFMAANAAHGIGDLVGALSGQQSPYQMMQQKMMEIKQKVDQQGFTDPVDYLKYTGSEFFKNGMPEQAMKAFAHAQEIEKAGGAMEYQKSQTAMNKATTAKTEADVLNMPMEKVFKEAKADLERAEANLTGKKVQTYDEEFHKKMERESAEIDKLKRPQEVGSAQDKMMFDILTKTNADRVAGKPEDPVSRGMGEYLVMKAKQNQNVMQNPEIGMMPPNVTLDDLLRQTAKPAAPAAATKPSVIPKVPTQPKIIQNTSKSGKPIQSSDGGKTWQYVK